jgi:hypothetical protein
MNKMILVAAFLVSGFAGSERSSATSYQITFGASDFSDPDFNSPAPVPFVLGQFDLSFDRGHDITGDATVDFLNINSESVGFEYPPSDFGPPPDFMVISGLRDSGVMSQTDDFFLTITNFSTSPTFDAFAYAQAGSKTVSIWSSTNGFVHVTATPIPATLPLTVSALGGLGWLGWRHRRMMAG